MRISPPQETLWVKGHESHNGLPQRIQKLQDSFLSAGPLPKPRDREQVGSAGNSPHWVLRTILPVCHVGKTGRQISFNQFTPLETLLVVVMF